MKLQRKHKQLLALAIGVVIVLFGLLQALFRFNIDRTYIDQAIFVLFVVAIALLYSGKPGKKDQNDSKGE